MILETWYVCIWNMRTIRHRRAPQECLMTHGGDVMDVHILSNVCAQKFTIDEEIKFRWLIISVYFYKRLTSRYVPMAEVITHGLIQRCSYIIMSGVLDGATVHRLIQRCSYIIVSGMPHTVTVINQTWWYYNRFSLFNCTQWQDLDFYMNHSAINGHRNKSSLNFSQVIIYGHLDTP